MKAPRSHAHAGRDIRPRLRGIAVEHESVDAFAERPVPEILDVAWMALPFFSIGGRERLRAENHLAVDVRRRRHLGATVSGAELIPRPEFRHRFVGLAAVGHLVSWHIAVGFDGKPQTVPVRQSAEFASVILNNQVGNGLTQIPQEAFRHLGALHDAPGECGQKFPEVVAAPGLKLLAHLRRPVLRADFPTVNVR